MLRSLSVTLLALAAISCGHSRATRDASAATQPAPSRAAQGPLARTRCPMDIPGTKVQAATTDTGATLTFTTTPDRAAELRQMVRQRAEMHTAHHAGAAAGHHGPGGMHGGGMGMPPPSRAVAEDVENGARLTLTPLTAADLGQLQSFVGSRAEHMQAHGCGPMD